MNNALFNCVVFLVIALIYCNNTCHITYRRLTQTGFYLFSCLAPSLRSGGLVYGPANP